jgi:hypothetical protein
MLTINSLARDLAEDTNDILFEYDKNNFNVNYAISLNRKVSDFIIEHIDRDLVLRVLQRSANYINDIEVDSYVLSEFISSILNSDKVDAAKLRMIDLTTKDNVSFKPQYLTDAISDVRFTINRYLNGTLKSSDLKKKILDAVKYNTVLRKRTVSGAKNYYASPKDLAKYDDEPEVYVTSQYLSSVVIPFIKNCPKTKRALVNDINDITSSINSVYTEIKNLTDDINDLLTDSELSKDKLSIITTYSYNYIRAIIDTSSFLAFSMLKKAHVFEARVTSCQNMYDQLVNIFNTSIPIVESGGYASRVISGTDTHTITENFLDGQNDVYSELAHNIMEYHIGFVSSRIPDNTFFSSSVNANISNKDAAEFVKAISDEYTYDKFIYDNITKSYIEISNGLDIIAKNSDDYLMIFDELIEKSGFLLTLSDRFSNIINSIEDTSDYATSDIDIGDSGQKMDTYFRILADISSYPDNTKSIAETAHDVKEKLDYVNDIVGRKKNGELAYSEAMNELKIFMESLEEQFVEYTRKIVRGLYLRLKSLANKADMCIDNLSGADGNSNPNPLDTLDFDNNEDYTEESGFDYLDLKEQIHDIEMEKLYREYCIEREFVETGFHVVYEADGTTNGTAGAAGTTTGTGTTGGTQTGGATTTTTTATTTTGTTTGTQNGGKSSTGVVVNDGENISSTSRTGINQAAINKIIQIAEKWIKDLTEKFQNTINRLKKLNLQWLQNNKEGLTNRSYANVSVQILPYDKMPPDKITTDLRTLGNNIKAINRDELENNLNTEDDIIRKLFAFVPNLPTGQNANDLVAYLTNYYKVGSNKVEDVTYSNNQVKTLVTEQALPFCIDYYGSFSQNIIDECNNIEKSLEEQANKEKDNASQGATNTQTNKDTPSMYSKYMMIYNNTRKFTGAVLNAIRDRNNDYLKVLRSLAPKGGNNTGNAQPQPNNNQQNQNTEQNANAENTGNTGETQTATNTQ